MLLTNNVKPAIEIAIKIIKEFEGLSLIPYVCPGGHETIGYGHVIKKVEHFDKITEQEALQLLIDDIEYFVKKIDGLVDMPLGINELAALISFVFNVGHGNFAKSTMRRKINNNEYAADEFLRWDKSNGVVLAGLTRRREAERDLFLGKGKYAESL